VQRFAAAADVAAAGLRIDRRSVILHGVLADYLTSIGQAERGEHHRRLRNSLVENIPATK
jgi:hypothetical protein